jgi:hypothetical protein
VLPESSPWDGFPISERRPLPSSSARLRRASPSHDQFFSSTQSRAHVRHYHFISELRSLHKFAPRPFAHPHCTGIPSTSHENSFLGRFYSLFRPTQFNACDTPSRSPAQSGADIELQERRSVVAEVPLAKGKRVCSRLRSLLFDST